MGKYAQYIEEKPNVCGGYPVIKGSRIPVRTVIAFWRECDGDFQQLVRTLPQVSPAALKAAIAYYARHPERVDEDSRRNETAWRELTGQPWPASE